MRDLALFLQFIVFDGMGCSRCAMGVLHIWILICICLSRLMCGCLRVMRILFASICLYRQRYSGLRMYLYYRVLRLLWIYLWLSMLLGFLLSCLWTNLLPYRFSPNSGFRYGEALHPGLDSDLQEFRRRALSAMGSLGYMNTYLEHRMWRRRVLRDLRW